MAPCKANRPWSSRCKATLAALSLLSALVGALHADSLWKEDSSRSMFSDKRASRIGDILTILVQESHAASKEATTKTAKKSGLDASLNSILFSPAASGFMTKAGKLPALNMQSKNEFEGGGAVNNSEKITARIAVRVIETLPNGNLLVEGRRQTAFANEKQEAVLRGTVRPEDVLPNNTVFSYNVADATIQFVSKGSVTDTQKKGWFTRIWDKLTPF